MKIDRDDMLELTRRMTVSRTCFDRIAGAYIDEYGEIDESFNIHFGKLTGADKAKYLEIAKAIPFSKTNVQLKEYTFSDAWKGKDSMWQLLLAIRQCGLKNDALLEVLYEQLADGYPVEYPYTITVFHGVYDIPRKGKDKESQWESEEVFDFMIVTISPMKAEYEPAEPVFGFLYPAFANRCGDVDKVDIFHANPEQPEEGILYKLFGRAL